MMETKYERLIVGMAYGESSRLPLLVILRDNGYGETPTVINYFVGTEAKDFYDKLYGVLPNGQRTEEVVRELVNSIDEEEEKDDGQD